MSALHTKVTAIKTYTRPRWILDHKRISGNYALWISAFTVL